MNRSHRATPHVPATSHHSNPKHRGWFPSQAAVVAEKMDEERPPDHAATCDDQLEPDNLAEREEAAMAKRLEVWVQRHLACLPKSESRLLRALRTDLCSVKRQVWTADALFERMVGLGHIEVVESEATAPVEADNPEDSERPPMARERAHGRRPPRRQPRVRVELIFHTLSERRVESEGGGGGGDEAEEAAAVVMEKVRRWVERQAAHPQLRPTSVEAAKRALAQLCVVSVSLQPERLIELLAEKNYLRLDQTEGESARGLGRKVVWLLKPTVGSAEGKRKSEEASGDQHHEERTKGTDATEREDNRDSSARKRVRSV